jgi:Mannosyltransferase (PIG-V)
MNPDTAELAIVDTASELVVPFEPSPGTGRRRLAAYRRWTRLREDPAHVAAVSDSWRALLASRLLIWAAAVGTLVAFGFGPVRHAFIPTGVTRGFGWLGDLLAAPAARWDASWYLVIAHYGYRPELFPFTSSRTAFFPVYPIGVRAIAWLGAPPVLAGVLLSMFALALALYGIHRLTALELGQRLPVARGSSGDVARLAVLLTAFAPMAFFFSAVYSESLYLALSVGVFWCARQGRWMWVGVLGALAAATRSTGLVLALPALMLYLYGPRQDRPADFAALARSLRPRYRIRRDILWLLLLPVGLAVYLGYLGLAGGDPLSPFHVQQVWGRHFAGPYLGAWDGIKAGFDGLRQLASLQRHPVYFAIATGDPFVTAGHNLLLLAFLAAAVVAIVGVLRLLPLAYGAYVIAALALPLSYPVRAQPLMSLPRFLVVLFPLAMWLAAWLAVRPRAQRPALVLSAALMALFAAQFATWHWVA